MYKLYDLFSDSSTMETKQIDLSWLVYLVIMITIFTVAV